MKHEFITKWQKELPESQRSEFELDVYKYMNQPKPKLNPIERAYEDWVKIRSKNWDEHEWIQKHSVSECLSNTGKIYLKYEFGNFKQNPEHWELYTEPEAQPEPAKTFDRNRFEAMFRAVVANGDVHSGEFFQLTEALLQQLDAYYASMEGGKHE